MIPRMGQVAILAFVYLIFWPRDFRERTLIRRLVTLDVPNLALLY